MCQRGVRYEKPRDNRPVEQRQRSKAQGSSQRRIGQDAGDQTDNDRGRNKRIAGAALDKRYLGRPNDVDDERLRQQRLHEPARLEERRIVPGVEDE